MHILWTYVKANRTYLVLALVLAAINQIFSLLDPIIFRFVIDNYALQVDQLTRTEFVHGILLLLGGMVCVAFISRTAKTFQDYFVNVVTQRVGTSMYAQAVKHTLSLPYQIFEDRRSGEILQKLQKARLDIQTAIESSINIVFLSAVGIIFCIIYAYTIHPYIGTTFFTLIPLLGYIVYLISKSIRLAQKKIVLESSELAGSTTETLRNVELVKSLGLERQEVERLNTVNERILDLELIKIRIMRKLSFIQGTVVNFLRTTLLFLMLYLIYIGSITLGELMSLFFFSFFIFSPLQALGKVASDYQQARASMETLNEVLSIPPQKQAGDTEIKHINTIEFNNVHFTYETQQTPAVHDVSFTLKEGRTIAFAGASGSGKSTIVKLLVGLYQPSNGEILVNRQPLHTLDLEHYRKRIGFVAQETQLFAGAIKQNLLFVNPNATDKECERVLRMANIWHIAERGTGLETKIGEGGIRLSGGEKQRLAIARALLRKPDVLIFDEATSSLDTQTEQAITATIEEIRNARPELMMILIAHRLSTITNADKIYVLKHGKILEKGTHKQLLLKRGLYYAFWKQQR